MVNLLLSGYGFHKPFIAPALKKYLYEGKRVCVAEFAFGEECKNETDWEKSFGEGSEERKNIETAFDSFGILPEHILWINYFRENCEEACKKIKDSDILFLPGGLPDKMMKRLTEFRLLPVLKTFQGMVIGVSAGALIQAENYFVSPDSDYENYIEAVGLPFITDFAVEVHYCGSLEQKESIQRYMKERKKPVYGIGEEGGVLVENRRASLFGKVSCFMSVL